MFTALAVTAALIATPGTAQAATPTGGEKTAWTYVSSKNPRTSYWNSSEDAPVGKGPRGAGRYRSFFRMDTSKVAGKHILAGFFQTYLNSGPCDTGVELWVTGEITPETTWRHQPKWLGKIDGAITSDQYGGCFIAWRTTDLVTEAAARGDRYLTFGLRSADERHPGELRVFESDMTNHPYFGRLRVPWLQMDYNTAPDVPSEPNAWNASGPDECYGDLGAPVGDGGYVRTTTPGFSARLTDDDNGWQQIRGRFQWAATPGGDTLGEAVTAFTYLGDAPRVCVPAGQLTDGNTYVWRVRAEDQYQPAGDIDLLTDIGEWSPWQTFTVDTTPPGQPTVSSAVYPQNATGAPIGTPGEFTLTPGDPSDVVRYEYRFSLGSVYGSVPAGADGTATVTFTPTIPVPMTLTVTAFDRGGNRSPNTVYRFRPSSYPAPAVSSTAYPPGLPAGGVGVPGEFTFAPNGAKDIAGYRYRLNSGSVVTVPTGQDGTATATVTPDTADTNTLTVQSVDARGIASPSRAYIFVVADTPPSTPPASPPPSQP
ncbi:hypothetical protein DQ384_01735 [Sphaerisporangium album]|uniref:DNRLRE domain-containing protein n=1 Tax=Sphaerisporangium album TaxID=509200 RepID=A0A367FUB5_9ACTN|nr:hypothetical protein [Sphaerisporangium album]RCG33185.1 hypothetical protein DQ384_01735 [Sphaerisporangium album]